MRRIRQRLVAVLTGAAVGAVTGFALGMATQPPDRLVHQIQPPVSTQTPAGTVPAGEEEK